MRAARPVIIFAFIVLLCTITAHLFVQVYIPSLLKLLHFELETLYLSQRSAQLFCKFVDFLSILFPSDYGPILLPLQNWNFTFESFKVAFLLFSKFFVFLDLVQNNALLITNFLHWGKIWLLSRVQLTAYQFLLFLCLLNQRFIAILKILNLSKERQCVEQPAKPLSHYIIFNCHQGRGLFGLDTLVVGLFLLGHCQSQLLGILLSNVFHFIEQFL